MKSESKLIIEKMMGAEKSEELFKVMEAKRRANIMKSFKRALEDHKVLSRHAGVANYWEAKWSLLTKHHKNLKKSLTTKQHDNKHSTNSSIIEMKQEIQQLKDMINSLKNGKM